MTCDIGKFAKIINDVVLERTDSHKAFGLNHGEATKKALDETYIEFAESVATVNSPGITRMFEGKFGKDRVKIGIKENEIPQLKKAIKKSFDVKARILQKDEKIETVINGVVETTKNGKKGDYVLIGPKGEEYTVEPETVSKKYIIPENINEDTITLKTKPSEIEYTNATKSITFTASWGEKMIAEPGDALVYENGKLSYRIEKEIFSKTYNSENKTEEKETVPFDVEEKIKPREEEMVPNYVTVFGQYTGDRGFRSKYFSVGPENFKNGKILIPWESKNGKGNYYIDLKTGISGTEDWYFEDLIGYKPYVPKSEVPVEEDEYIRPLEAGSKEIDISALNEGQAKAYGEMVAFLNNEKSKEHVLIGPGGTGKTFTIDKISEYLKKNLPYNNVVYLAPTHQAKLTLNKSINSNNNGAETPVNTIASALGLTMDEEGDFKSDRASKITSNDILIIDESSMITEKEYKKIMEILNSGSGKVIFMGDNAQLPPIRDKEDADIAGIPLNKLQNQDSPAFGKNTSHHSVLTKVERFNEDSKLGKIIAKLRDSVFKDPGNPLNKDKGIFDGEGYKDDTSEVIYTNSIEEIEDSFIEDYMKNPTGTRIITGNNESHTNPASVMNLNKRIRAELHPEAIEEFVKGDTLIAYEGLKKGKKTLLNKGMTYEVIERGPIEKKIFIGEAKKKNGGMHRTELKLEYQILTLKEVDGMNDSYVNIAVPIPGDKGMQKYISTLLELNREKNDAYKNKDFSLGAELTMELMAMQNMGQEAFGKLLLSYAMTAHKAQGSSVDNTYVMGDNISNFGGSTYGNPKTQSQMMYVAASRTKGKLVIHGKDFGRKPLTRYNAVSIFQPGSGSSALDHINRYYKTYAKALIEKIKAEKKPEVTMSTILASELLSGAANFGASSIHENGTERIIYPDFLGLATKTDAVTLELKKEIMDREPEMTEEEFAAWMKQMHISDWLNKTKVHEHIHTATSKFMEANPDHEYTVYVRSVYEIVLEFAKNNPDHAITKLKRSEKNPLGYWSESVDEFLAEALSQPEMIEFLSTHDLGMNHASSEKSILSKIIEKILGMIYPSEAIDNNAHKMLLDATIAMSKIKIQEEKESAPEQDFGYDESFIFDDEYAASLEEEIAYREEIYGSNYENMSKFFNTSLDDFIISEEEIDLERDLFTVFNDLFDKDTAVLTNEEDYGKQRLGIYSKEFLNRVQNTLEKIKKTVHGLDTKSIKFTHISTSLDERFDAENEFRETAGKFRQKRNGEAEIQLRWNRFNGTASQSEIFVHELIHYMTHKAFEDSPEYREKLNDLKKAVLASGSVDYKIFLKHYDKQNELGLNIDGDGNKIEIVATEAEIQVAKNKFEYVFGKTSSPEEFFAYAMSNEFVYEAIKDIKITPKHAMLINLIEAKEGKKLNFVYELLNTFIDVINDIWIGQSGRNQKGAEMIMDLFYELAEKQANMEKSLGREQNRVDKDTLKRLGEFVKDADKTIKPYFDKFEKAKDEIVDEWFKGDSIKKWIGKVDRASLLGRFIESDLVPEIWNSIVKKTDDKQWADIYQMFRVIKQQTEKYRTDLESSLNKVIDSYLDKTSAGEKELIASMVFRLDLKSLMNDSKHTFDDIFNLIDNDEKLDYLIKNETIELKKLYQKRSITRGQAFTSVHEELRNDIEQMDGLAYHMATGNFSTLNQQMNANNIYNKFYMTGSKKIDPNQPIRENDTEIIAKMDQLITYKAMRKSSPIDRRSIKKYIKEHENSENIIKLIDLHDGYVKNSRKDLSKNNFDHIAKGAIGPKTTKRKFELVPEDMVKIKSKLGMKGEEVYGVIGGVKYIKMFGDSSEPGYTEGALSISNHRIGGISLRSLLANQIRKKAREDGVMISTAKVDETVNDKLERIITNGGKSRSISIRGGHNMVPVHDINGKIIDYNMQMSEEDKHVRMDYNLEVGEMLAYTFADIAHQKIVTDKNKAVIRKLLSYSKKHLSDDPDGFVILKPHESGSGKQITKENEKWNSIPDYTKDYIHELTGKHELAVPKEFLTLMVGYKNATLGNLNILGFDMQNHQTLRDGVMLTETYVSEVLGYLKRIIVVLNASVVGANTVSNMTVAMWHGMGPIEYIKRAKAMWINLDRYEELARELSELQVRSHAGENVAQAIKNTKKQMKDNNFHYLVEDGQFSPIVEDVNVDKQAKGHLTQKISNLFESNSMMEGIGEVADQLFVNRSTRLYAKALKVTQYGDIISREIIRQREEEKFEKQNNRGMNPEERQELLNYLDQLFVNYGYLDNKYLKWFETVAGMFFTKYLFRQGKALHRSFEKNPTLATFFEVAQIGTGIDVPTPLDTFYNPIDALLNREQLADPLGIGMNIITPNVFTLVPGFDSLGIKFN